MPILAEIKNGYLAWHSFLIKLPRVYRHSIGAKIDTLFTDLIELSIVASYAHGNDKYAALSEMSRKLDFLKYFITILWEAKGLDTKKYSALAEKLGIIGKMLGGWMKQMRQ